MLTTTITPAILLQWYNEYNALFFHGELPPATVKNFEIRHYSSHLGVFHHPRTILGKALPWRISETDYYEIPERDRRHTMLHEMCHAWCFHQGFADEHHGERWRAKALEVGRAAGFDIERRHKGKFEIAEKYRSKADSKRAAKEKPCPFLVFPWEDDKVFIVKTTKSVLTKHVCLIGGEYRLNTFRKPEGLFLSDAFPKWTTRRSLRWGTVISRNRYVKEILPKLLEGKEYPDPLELLRNA